MAITPDTALAEYQSSSGALMDVVQDYTAPQETRDKALAAAQQLSVEFIENTINDITALNEQYASFIGYMEGVIADLEGGGPLEAINQVKTVLDEAKVLLEEE